MKTTKTLAVLIFFLITNSLLAQKKQNDATWQETINFINKYKNQLDFKVSPSWNDKGYNNIKFIEITGNLLIIHPEQDWFFDHHSDIGIEKKYYTKLQSRIALNLENLSSYYANSNSFYFTKNITFSYQVKVVPQKTYNPLTGSYFQDDEYIESRTFDNDNIHFKFDGDSELRPRLIKAFEHLAYLAKEKRKQQRKASGDKF